MYNTPRVTPDESRSASDPRTATGPVGSALAGLRLPLEGAETLLRERALWWPAAVPVLLSLLAFALAVAAIVAGADTLWAFATSFAPELTAERWWAWLWVGPAKAGLLALEALVFLALCAVALVGAYLLASLVASPFHDALSRRVERLVTGAVVDASAPGVRGLLGEGLRAVAEEARRLAFFLALVGPLVLLGIVVPPAHVVTGPAVVAITILFLPLDYASYTLDRRRISFREKRVWLQARKPLMAGFGSAAFLLCLVPVLNFAATPVLVVAGTFLALRNPPQAPGQPPSASSPR